MAGATTTTLSTLVKPIVADEATVLKYTSKEFFAALKAAGMPDMRAVGDTAFRWKLLRSTGNSSVETFVEGQGIPTAGSQTWTEAAVSWVYHRVLVQLTGHARDAMGSHYLGEQWAGAGNLSGETAGAYADLEDLMNNTFLGSGTNGILNAVDSTGTYAGLAKATFTDFASFEEAGGGAALTVAMLDNTWEAVRDNDRGGAPEVLLMPHNQVTNYANLAGVGATTSLVRFVANGTAPKLDAGWDTTGLTYHNLPIHGIGDMTDTEILMLSGIAQNFLFATIRPIEVKPLAVTDDSESKTQISTGGTLVCRNPRTQGKITNLAA
jgi:hypothetical protein